MAESRRLGRPSRRPWALWGLPTLYLRLTLGLRWAYLGLTFGLRSAYVGLTLDLPSVMSLAIPGRFWVILAESPVKRRDRRCVFYEMIDFPIRKRHFLVWWSVGGPWEPPGRKKKTKPNVPTVAPIGRKKKKNVQALFFSRKKEHFVESIEYGSPKEAGARG